MNPRGCVGAAVLAFAAFAALFSFTGTIEMETFPGLRENRGPLIVYMCVFVVLLAAAGIAAWGRRSAGAWAGAVGVLALVALRMYTLAPVLHCWSYDSVGRNDGSYYCVNRGSGL